VIGIPLSCRCLRAPAETTAMNRRHLAQATGPPGPATIFPCLPSPSVTKERYARVRLIPV
jgi:hypothetical protein